MSETRPSFPKFPSLEAELDSVDYCEAIIDEKHGEREVNIDGHLTIIHVTNNLWMHFDKFESHKGGPPQPHAMDIADILHREIFEDPESRFNDIFEKFESTYPHLYQKIHNIIAQRRDRTKRLANVKRAFTKDSDQYRRMAENQFSSLTQEQIDMDDYHLSKALDGLAQCANELGVPLDKLHKLIDMSNREKSPDSAEGKARETLSKMALALVEASAAIDPDDRRDLLEIFPEPGERRADTQINLPPEREKALREAMAKLGIGREANVSASEAGLPDKYVVVVEGGQAHKMAAELEVVLADSVVLPSEIFLTATPFRSIRPDESDPARERYITAKTLGIDISSVQDNEYEVAQQVLKATPGYHHNPVASHSGEEGPSVVPQLFNEVGFVKAGDRQIPVILMAIIREDLGSGRYRQPGTREILKTIDEVLTAKGEDADVGFATSATYQPSRETDIVSTMLELSRVGRPRHIGLITYGTHELAKVKKVQVPEPVALGQLAAEAHKAAKQLGILRDLLP
jgi:hypothetical protein